MNLAELRRTISSAIQQISNASVIDENVLNACLNEIALPLFQADVHFKLVRDMQTNVKNIANNHDLVEGHNKHMIIRQAIFNELCKILDTGKASFVPEKGKKSVVLFVGLQESGKTTACAKYMNYHRRKGWKPALVYADTFCVSAFDELMQHALEARIPFHGSLRESDPVKIAVEGVKRFMNEQCDLIIVDSGGRHKQENSLFQELHQISEATKPDLVIFVADSSTGQAAMDQAQAFKQNAAAGAVIVTKMYDQAKGVGTLSALAATRTSPVVFVERGEHLDEFDVKSFVNCLLGVDDLPGPGLMEEVITPVDKYQNEFTFRSLHEQFQFIHTRRKLKIPKCEDGLLVKPPIDFSDIEKSAIYDLDSNSQQLEKFSRYMSITNSMTNQELDLNPKLMDCSCITRIAKRCGIEVSEVMEMLEDYKMQSRNYAKMIMKFNAHFDSLENVPPAPFANRTIILRRPSFFIFMLHELYKRTINSLRIMFQNLNNVFSICAREHY